MNNGSHTIRRPVSQRTADTKHAKLHRPTTIKFRSDFLWSASWIWYFYEVSQQEVDIAKLAATDMRTVTSSSMITSTVSYGKPLIAAEPDTTEPFSALRQFTAHVTPSDGSCCCLREMFIITTWVQELVCTQRIANVCRWLSAIEL